MHREKVHSQLIIQAVDARFLGLCSSHILCKPDLRNLAQQRFKQIPIRHLSQAVHIRILQNPPVTVKGANVGIAA